MFPPPVLPPSGGQGGDRRAYRPEYRSPTEQVVLRVRPYGGGVPAEFDPRSGSLRPAPPGQIAGADGLYGDLGGVMLIFYRLADRLLVQVGSQAIDVTDGAHVGWERSPQRMTRFTVAVDGRPMGELIYRALPPELDLGLLVRNVVADPASRMTMFSDRA